MFGLNFLLENEEEKVQSKEDEAEEDSKSQFFNFNPNSDNEGSNFPQQHSSFKLNFNKVGGRGDCSSSRPETLESNEAYSSSHSIPSFSLFDTKPDLDNIVIVDKTEMEMDHNVHNGQKIDTDSCHTGFKSNIQKNDRENQAKIKSPGPMKSANLFSPRKTPLQHPIASIAVGSANDKPMDLCESTISSVTAEPVGSFIPEGPSRLLVSLKKSNISECDGVDKRKVMERSQVHVTTTTGTLNDVSSVPPGKTVRRNLFAGVTPKKSSQKIEPETPMKDDERSEGYFDSEIRGNPAQFVSFLRNQFGSTEEFGQFERYFYGQVEEVRMLRGNVEGLRSALVKTQEEKRVLELQLVSERALRDQDSKNALTDMEKNNMQLNTQIYSMKCEVETWKRKAEATLKESGWLKQQLKSVELEKTEAVRKLGELTRQHNGFEQYRISIEAYARRQRETMTDIQKRLLDLENARETLAALTDHNQKQMNFMAVYLKNRENHRFNSEMRVGALEGDLIKARADLVQNNAKLVRVQTCETKTAAIMDKLIGENKDLHCGLNLLVSTMQNNVETTNMDFINRIEKLHEDVRVSVQQLEINDSSP